MIPVLVFMALVGTQARVVQPPVLDDSNPAAAERGRRIEQSVICRKDDRIAVTVADGRVTAIEVDGRPDAEALAMTTNAIGDAEIASFNLTCYERSVMLAPYDKTGGLLGALTLRYRK